MKIYLALIIFIFVGCAAQMAPKGGPVDTNGPNLIKVSHMSTSNIAGTTDKIIFYFDEDIDPISVVNAIDVLNFDDPILNICFLAWGNCRFLRRDSPLFLHAKDLCNPELMAFFNDFIADLILFSSSKILANS